PMTDRLEPINIRSPWGMRHKKIQGKGSVPVNLRSVLPKSHSIPSDRAPQRPSPGGGKDSKPTTSVEYRAKLPSLWDRSAHDLRDLSGKEHGASAML
ncbi:MAG: hypothetical protein ACK53L_02470, partial [Pirellulaceae bacterium]